MGDKRQALKAKANTVLEEAIERALFGKDPVVIVKSPPGAGKTYLIECAVAFATRFGMSVVVVTPGVSQLYDVTERLLEYRLPRLELVHAKHRTLPTTLDGRINASKGWEDGLNIGSGVIVTNAHQLAAHLKKLDRHVFDLMILDEAYQLAASDLLPIFDLAPRVMMVGDPGQLDPVNTADTSNLEAGKHKIHWSSPAYVLDRFPDTPVFGLPVTRRLLPDTAALIQSSFYPDLSFHSIVAPNERGLHFPIRGIEPAIDGALDAIADGASLVAVTVPGAPSFLDETDSEVASVMAHLADRILQRQAEWVGQRYLTEADIGCIDPHVSAGGAIRDALRKRGRGGIRVETVERWQGLQLPISIVRHPLSIAGRPSGFDLEAGRWCVSLSRHQIGCIIVARESVTGRIRDYVHGCDTVAAGAKDSTWKGFTAHKMIWKSLADQGRIFSL